MWSSDIVRLKLLITADATRWLGQARPRLRIMTDYKGAKQTLNITRNPAIV
jgi:hypothetical protein